VDYGDRLGGVDFSIEKKAAQLSAFSQKQNLPLIFTDHADFLLVLCFVENYFAAACIIRTGIPLKTSFLDLWDGDGIFINRFFGRHAARVNSCPDTSLFKCYSDSLKTNVPFERTKFSCWAGAASLHG
jgi:hypothetical protein